MPHLLYKPTRMYSLGLSQAIFLFWAAINNCPRYVFCAPPSLGIGEPAVAEYLRDSDADQPRPPILFLPGIVSTRLQAWKRKMCRGPDIEVQDVVWLNLQKLVETLTYDKNCWLDCLKLDKNGTDPKDCKIRPEEGLSAIGEMAPGNLYTPPATSIFTALIKTFASELGYDVTNLIGAPYDWRLAPIQMQKRDSFFTTLKLRLEVAVKRHKRPAIVIAHSMGTNVFMYFCDWLRVHEKPAIGWEHWIRRHIWGFVGMAAPLLGAAGALKAIMSGHTFGLPISDAQARDIMMTFHSTHFLNPRSSQRRRKGETANSNFTADYRDPIVTMKSISGSSEFPFSIDDVENGELFRLMGNILREDRMIDKYNALHDLYTNDPLKPLDKLYKRPPIKHVIMIYGVDIPTEIGYVYRSPDGANPSGTAPILDEVLYEEPCKRKIIEEEVEVKVEVEEVVVNGHISTGGGRGGGGGGGIVVSAVAGGATGDAVGQGGGTNSVCAVSDDPALTATGSEEPNAQNTAEEEGGGMFPADKLLPYSDHHLRWLQSASMEFEWTSSMIISSADSCSSSSSSGNGAKPEFPSDIITAGGDKDDIIVGEARNQRNIKSDGPILGDRPTDEASTSTAVSKSKRNIDGTAEISKEGKGNNNKKKKAAHRRKYAECNAEVFAVKTKKQGLSQPKRRFVRHSEQKHSGDYTVPYVSLSFAHTWLEGGTEADNKRWHEHRPRVVHRHLLDNWAPSAMASKVASIDPEVDLYYSERSNGDTTAVIEVEGVDHLDIAKSSYVHFLMFEYLMPKVTADLCLLPVNQTATTESSSSSSSPPTYSCNYEQASVPLVVPDLQEIGKKATEAAKDAFNGLMKYVRGS